MSTLCWAIGLRSIGLQFGYDQVLPPVYFSLVFYFYLIFLSLVSKFFLLVYQENAGPRLARGAGL